MRPETIKTPIEELTQEELIVLLYELMNRVRELEEKLHLKTTPTTSKNSSQPPSRDFKPEKKKRERGVLTLDVPANQLSLAVINRYLELKSRTLLVFYTLFLFSRPARNKYP